MLAHLKNHPFDVEAFFEYSLVLTYAIPQEELQTLIPECLKLDTFQGKWAFVAIAFVQTKALRPKGLPAFMGNDFFLIGYRIFVQYTTNLGKRLRGLYILKSETDSRRMELLGSLFSRYQYTTIDINQILQGAILQITSKKSGLDVVVNISSQNRSLPFTSPFSNWQEARRYAGPLPFTFSYNPETREVLIVEGIREHWQPTPVQVLRADSIFFDSFNLPTPILASAFIIKDIPYQWKRGRTEQWNR